MAKKIIDCDLVVLGAAGSGLTAAVKAADVSGKKVVVLEKAKKCGGASVFASGMGEVGSIVDSTWQKEAGIPVNDPPDIRGQWFDWLLSKGGLDDYFSLEGESIKNSKKRMEQYQKCTDPSIGPGKMGHVVVNKMLECCEKQGIDVYTETPAKKFITDSSGKVTAVLADSPEGELQVNCKAVAICAGGFGRNYEMLQARWPEQFNGKEIHCLCPPGITGDGINMAEEIGAAIDQTEWGLSFPGGFYSSGAVHHPYSYSLMGMGDSRMVSINLNGVRWGNEQNMMGDDIGSQPNGIVYTVGDSDLIEELGSNLLHSGMAAINPYSEDSEEYRCMMRWKEELEYEIQIDEEGASGNHAKRANTFAELALKMGVDPAKFVETMENYNEYCKTGKDLEFGKSAEALQPLVNPPYYAIFGHRFSQCTKGRNGIAVNPNFEAMDKNGKAIPGLYAAGDGCTIYGDLILNIQGGGAGGQMESKVAGPYVMPESGNILDGSCSCCGGLGASFISGYYVGVNAGKYIS